MIRYKFSPSTPLIVIETRLEHIYVDFVKMALDTASTRTVVTPAIAQRIGFNLEDSHPTETVYTAERGVKAVRLLVPKISFQIEDIKDIEVVCMPLPRQLRVDGLLGLNILRHFKITIDFEQGLLLFDKINIPFETAHQ